MQCIAMCMKYPLHTAVSSTVSRTAVFRPARNAHIVSFFSMQISHDPWGLDGMA